MTESDEDRKFREMVQRRAFEGILDVEILEGLRRDRLEDESDLRLKELASQQFATLSDMMKGGLEPGELAIVHGHPRRSFALDSLLYFTRMTDPRNNLVFLDTENAHWEPKNAKVPGLIDVIDLPWVDPPRPPPELRYKQILAIVAVTKMRRKP